MRQGPTSWSTRVSRSGEPGHHHQRGESWRELRRRRWQYFSLWPRRPAMKVALHEVVHKSDAGGVKLKFKECRGGQSGLAGDGKDILGAEDGRSFGAEDWPGRSRSYHWRGQRCYLRAGIDVRPGWCVRGGLEGRILPLPSHLGIRCPGHDRGDQRLCPLAGDTGAILPISLPWRG